MRKIIIALLVFLLMFSTTCFAVEFTDVSGHWAEKYIVELTNRGIINGYGDGTFQPEGTIKKSEFLKLIMVASIPDYDWTQPNVKYNHWASIFIETAERYGIIEEGSITEENANEEISRIDMVKILGRCDISIRNSVQFGNNVEFYDIADIDESQYLMLSHCVGKGYINGYEDFTFKPDNTLKRSEVAAVLFRYLGI